LEGDGVQEFNVALKKYLMQPTGQETKEEKEWKEIKRNTD